MDATAASPYAGGQGLSKQDPWPCADVHAQTPVQGQESIGRRFAPQFDVVVDPLARGCAVTEPETVFSGKRTVVWSGTVAYRCAPLTFGSGRGAPASMTLYRFALFKFQQGEI